MNPVVAFITAAHVLLHGVFGCCGHAFTAWADGQGHQCVHGSVGDAGGCAHQHTHSDAIAGHHAEDHFRASAAAGEPAAPCEGHECPHDSCSWVAAADAPTLPSGVVLDWTPLDIAAPAGVVSVGTLAEMLLRFDGAKTPALPVRLHLAVGVLLI